MKKFSKTLVVLIIALAIVIVPTAALAAADNPSSCGNNNRGNCAIQDSCATDIRSNADSQNSCSLVNNNSAANQSSCYQNSNNNAATPKSCAGNGLNSAANQNSCSTGKTNSACAQNNCTTGNNSVLGSQNNCTSNNSLVANGTKGCTFNDCSALFDYLWQYLYAFTANQGCSVANIPKNASLYALPDAATTLTPNVAAEYAQYIQQVVDLVNKERASAGLNALVLDEKLTEAAAIRAIEVQTVFDHTRPDGTDCFTAIDQVGGTYTAVGENIAIGYSTPEEVMTDWMNSPGHRAAIMNPKYTRIGVALAPVDNAKYVGYSWTQFFAD